MSRLEGDGNPDLSRGVASLIARLAEAGRVPREIAAMMRVVSEIRNVVEYQAKSLSAAEAETVTGAWRVVSQWGETSLKNKGDGGKRGL